MFACSSAVRSDADATTWMRVLRDQLPLLLPCATCRKNMARHLPIVNANFRTPPHTAEHFVRWCWLMKHQVNRVTQHPSIPQSEVVARLTLHGPVVPEVEFADVLVFMALSARALNRDDVFVAFCHDLATILPLPADSGLIQMLARACRPVLQSAARTARMAREQHGLPVFPIAHYRGMASA